MEKFKFLKEICKSGAKSFWGEEKGPMLGWVGWDRELNINSSLVGGWGGVGWSMVKGGGGKSTIIRSPSV